MDYAFVYAINYISALLTVLLLYDIMCQFWINFLKRIAEVSTFISIPGNVVIKRGIGLFHVHGHVKECFPRFAPTFIQGAGTIDGEIIETLWNPLNHTASSARSMSWCHRQEYLDAHMGDSNWKKLVKMGMIMCSLRHFRALSSFVHTVPTLLRKWGKANRDLNISRENFLSLSSAVAASKVTDWTAAEKAAQRDRWQDVKSMDIFDVNAVEGWSFLFPSYKIHD